MSDSSSASSTPPPREIKKKRKRADPAIDELEIDVSLPEPPSKKALRRAKKGKPALPSTADVISQEDNSDLLDAPGSTTAASAAAAPPKRSEHSVWIGNLPFFCNPSLLKSFFCSVASLEASNITRINLPVTTRPLLPAQLVMYRRAVSQYRGEVKKAGGKDSTDHEPKFQNKGFAYVDFDSAASVFQALQATETEFSGGGGRKVLIKDAKSFVGRPEKVAPVSTGTETVNGINGAAMQQKPRSRRVFVGNLAFDVTRDDIMQHFSQAGTVEDVFVASFEDTGKCKGYAWVRFAEEDEAERAVKGWVWKVDGQDEDDGAESEEDVEDTTKTSDGEISASSDSDSDADSDAETKAKPSKIKKPAKPQGGKKRKWWINKLYGRMLRCEYAEDASTRYNKRFRKGDRVSGEGGPRRPFTPRADQADGDGDAIVEEPSQPKAPYVTPRHRAGKGKPGFRAGQTEDQRREQRRQKHQDARKIASGQALANAPRASAAIVAGKGTKVTFE